ncbi:MAG: DUF5693 family protein [Elusimicrobiota bacterium]
MSRLPRGLWPAFLLAATVAIVSFMIGARGPDDRVVVAAVDGESYSALAGSQPSQAGELWERLKAMGVGAVLLREETLADLAARGEILHFTRAEVEKWRVAGLASPGSALRGDSLWVKDPQVLARVAAALAARGLDVSTSVVAGARALELPPGSDLALVAAGFDLRAVAAVSSAGLMPIAVPSSGAAMVAGQELRVRTLLVDARREEILRAAASRPRRLLVFRLRADQGLDAALDCLREALRVLRESGLPSTLSVPRPAPERERRTVRLLLVWLLAAVGPLLSVRAALAAARLTRERLSPFEMGRQAQPVPEVLAGVAASGAAAALVGLLVAAIAPAGWRDGSARAWTLWTWCAPLVVAAASLFASQPISSRRWSKPIRRRDLLAALGFALAAALLLAPRASLRASLLWEGFDRLMAAAGALWWWPWRWREALVGVPSLVVALVFIEARPKAWLILGLLAPAGFLAAVGGSGAPITMTLAQGAVAHALGAVLGAGLAVLRGLLDQWAQGPKSHGSIDPEPMSS